MVDDLSLRCSDAERERTAQALRVHCEAGRLTVDEFDQRLDAVYAAKTRADLAALAVDLPALEEPAPAPVPTAPARRWFAPGIAPFREQVALHARPRTAYGQAMSYIVPAMSSAGYEMVERDPSGLITFRRWVRPAWTWLLAVLFFPVGLIALLVKREERVTVVFADRPSGGTLVTAFGRAPRAVRRAFALLGD
jgi:hypothetical protein